MKTDCMELTTKQKINLSEQNILFVPLGIDEGVKIMSLSATVCLLDSRVSAGDITYSGRITVNTIYNNGEICRQESGMEFTQKVMGDYSLATKATVNFVVSDITARKNSGGYFAECVINCEIGVFSEQSIEYVTDIDTLKNPCTQNYIECEQKTAVFDLDDEFETDKVDKVISSFASVKIKTVSQANGVTTFDGDVNLTILLLQFNQKNDIVKETRVIPFRFEVETSPYALEKVAIRACVNKLNLKVYAYEDGDKSKIESDIKIGAYVDYFTSQEIVCLCDAYSPKYNLDIKRVGVGFKTLDEDFILAKRISGKMDAVIPENSRFLATCSENIEVISRESENCSKIETMLTFDAIMVDGEQNIVSVPCRAPITIDIENAPNIQNLNVQILQLNTKYRSGNIEFDGELQISYSVFSDAEISLISEISLGGEKPIVDSAFSVYMASEGETEWDITKALGVSIDEIYEINPNLQFPLEKGEKIICFRKID